MIHDGTIDAATAGDARNKLAANGLAVRELEEIASSPGTVPVDVPRRAATKVAPAAELQRPPSRPMAREDRASTARHRSPLAMAFSILAFLLALTTASYVVYRDPPWGRLSKYDFSTPESAYTSYLRIEANGDLQAGMELQRKLQGKEVREKVETMRINQARDFQGKKALFIEYQRNRSMVREVVWLQKDPDQKLWKQTFVNPNEVQSADQRLAGEIQRWQTNFTGPGEWMFPPGGMGEK